MQRLFSPERCTMSGLEAITKRLPALESTQQKYTSASVEALGQLEEEIDRIVQLRAEGVRY